MEDLLQREDADVNTLYLARSYLRQQWLRRYAFLSLAAPTTAAKMPPPQATIVAALAINFMAGVHFTSNGSTMRDMADDARLLHMTLLNAAAHLTLTKRPASAATASAGTRAATRRSAQAASAGADAPAPAPDEAAATTTGPLPRCDVHVFLEYLLDERTRSIVVGIRFWYLVTQRRVLRLGGDVDATGDANNDDTAVCVLSRGVVASCTEARRVQGMIEKERTKLARSRKSLAIAPEHLERTIAYPWVVAKTPVDFHLRAVNRYYNHIGVPRIDASAGIDNDDCVLDPRRFLRCDTTSMNWTTPATYHKYASDRHMALSTIFAPAAAMAYYAHRIDHDQCRFELYYDTILGDDNDDNDGGGAGDEASLDLLLDARDGGEEPADDGSPLFALRRLLRSIGPGVAYARQRLPMFPRPGITYLVAPQVMSAEAFANVVLPHAMGEELAPAVIEGGIGASDPSNLAMRYMARAVHLLRRIEHASVDQDSTAMTYDMSHAALMTLTKTELEEAVMHENTVVNAALMSASEAPSDTLYRALLRSSDEAEHTAPSTANHMGAMDYLPEQHHPYSPNMRLRAAQQRRLFEQMREAAGPEANVDRIRELAELVSPSIDNVHPVLRERDDFLKERADHQAAQALLRIRTEFATEAAHNEVSDPAQLEHVLAALARKFRSDFWSARLRQACATFDTFDTSENIAQILIGARTWFRKHATAASVEQYLNETFGGKCPRQVIHARPYMQMAQQWCDFIKDVLHTSAQVYENARAFFKISLDAHFYKPNRSMPATNGINVGETGAGKSFIQNRVIDNMSVPGFIVNLADVTDKAMNTDTNMDNAVIIMEEMKSGLMYGKASDKDKGASDAVNLFKQRLTKFMVETRYPHKDEKTGERKTLHSVSSHHNQISGATNQYMQDFDKNVARRFILFFTPVFIGAGEGSGTSDQNVPSAFENVHVEQKLLHRWRLVYAAFVYVRTLIKTAVLPEVDTSAAEVLLDAVLADAGTTRFVNVRDATKRHFVLQTARNMQTYFACWQAIFSPLAHVYHTQDPNAYPRFSPEAIVTLVSPFLVVTYSALIDALTSLDFLYTPRYVASTLRVMATECLHLGDVTRWRCRTFPDVSGDKSLPPMIDGNYLCMSGRSDEDICAAIARLNREYEIRNVDILKFLSDLGREFITCGEITVTAALDPESVRSGNVQAFTRDPAARAEQRKAVIFENDPMQGNLRGRRLCVLIPFLEQYLGVRAGDAASVNALRQQRHVYEQNELSEEALLRHATSQVSMSPIADSIARVLSNRTFELDPELAPWLGKQHEMPFFTAYPLQPLSFYRNPRPSGNADVSVERQVRTVSLHGTHRLIALKRDAARAPITRENYTRAQVTSKMTFREVTRDGTLPTTRIATAYANALGITARGRDFTSTFAELYMRELCHPGLPIVEKILGMADEPDKRRPDVLPLAFEPLLTAVYERIAEANGDAAQYVDYPLDNVRARVHEAVTICRDAAQGTFAHFVEVDDIVGRNSFGGVSFSAVARQVESFRALRRERERAQRYATPPSTPSAPFVSAHVDAMDVDE